MIPSPMQPREQRLGPADDGLPDDVDRVFARLTQLPPPRDFTTNVLLAVQRVQIRQLGPRQIGWAIAELAAVLMLAVLAYTAGQALVGGGALALIAAVAADTEVLQLVPGETLLTLAESIPWLELLGVVIMGAAVAACARCLGRALAEPPLPTGRGAA
jgi:hypothetical protein